jgi:Zn finger protein HypA/HybF involved in hydrogenase expression
MELGNNMRNIYETKSHWYKADGDEECADCGETLEKDEDVFYSSRNERVYCEGCQSEMEDYEAGSWEDDDEYLIDGVGFQEPGGRSSLRAETEDNPRNLPCPQCGQEDTLTPLDRANGYVCNRCADRAEGREF